MCVCVCVRRSVVSDSATPWTVAHQAFLSMGFSRQEYWSGLPFLSPGDLPNPGIESGSPTLQADSVPFEPGGKSRISYRAHQLAITSLNFCLSSIILISSSFFLQKE